jgi:hypothetical protein
LGDVEKETAVISSGGCRPDADHADRGRCRRSRWPSRVELIFEPDRLEIQQSGVVDRWRGLLRFCLCMRFPSGVDGATARSVSDCAQRWQTG